MATSEKKVQRRGTRATTITIDADESKKLEKNNERARKLRRSKSRGRLEKDDGEEMKDDEETAAQSEPKPKRNFKRAVLKEDVHFIDKAVREAAKHSGAGMKATRDLIDLFSGAQPKKNGEKRSIRRADILPLLSLILESFAKSQERMLAVASNQKSFQDGVGNMLLDVLRGSLSSSANAVPTMPIAHARYMAGQGGSAPKVCVWDDIDALMALMASGRDDVEEVHFVKREPEEKKIEESIGYSTEEDEGEFFVMPGDEENEVGAKKEPDHGAPGQLASVFFGVAVSNKVRGRMAPPGIMNSDWLNSAVRTNRRAVDPCPTALVGGGSKRSAQRREASHGTTAALSMRRDSNVGAGITELSANVRQNMMPNVIM